jgi:NADH-quinone oxidoreductase subunit C
MLPSSLRLSPPADRWDVALLKEKGGPAVKEIYANAQGDVFVECERTGVLELAKMLHAAGCDYCAEVTAIDYLQHSAYEANPEMPRFTVAHVLYSIPKNTTLILRTAVPEDDCRMPSLANVWRGADWLEREVFDLMGIRFDGHPDLRRIMMWEGYEGYPERKDFPWRDPEWENPWRDRYPGKV